MDYAENGDYFIVGGYSSLIRYYDMTPPVSGVKDYLWEQWAGGAYWGGVSVAISEDGSIVASHDYDSEGWEVNARVYAGDP